MVSVIEALIEGFRRLLGTGKIVLWMYLLSLFLALVPTLIVSEIIEESLGQSLVAEDLSTGFNDTWYREFRLDAKGFGETFRFSVAGVGAVLDGVDVFLNGKIFQQVLAVSGLGILYLTLWILLSGGALHLYNTNDPVTLEAFMRGSGLYFFRFLRLATMAGLFYWLLYSYLLPFLGDLVQAHIREVIDERVAFAWTVAKYFLVLGVLVLVNLIVDYARILTVVQNRRSAMLAAIASFRFVIGHLGRTLSLYLIIGLLGLLFLVLYALLAPGGLQDSWSGVVWALVLGQAYIVSRIWIRLLFMASQSVLCASLDDRQHLRY